MFEIKENPEIENHEIQNEYLFLVNGEILSGVRVSESMDFPYDENLATILEFESQEFETTRKLLNFSFTDFVNCEIKSSKFCKLGRLTFNNWNKDEDFFWGIEIDIVYETIQFRIVPYFSYWKKYYSFIEYQELFQGVLNNNYSNLEITYANHKYNEFSEINYHVNQKLNDLKIAEGLSKYLLAFIDTHNKTIALLENNTVKDSILKLFNFPQDLKVSCEQYLLFFIQFLRDLGINATSSLREEAGKVLFSVTPTDDIEGLDKIREALAIYLNLPASPIVYDDSFAAMRLQQQIENLQHSQKMTAREIRAGERELLLAQTVIEQQDNVIRQKDTTIEQQNRIIEKITSPTIIMDSLENKEELVEVYEGLKIGESKFLKEQLGIHLNPVKFVKKAVENTFGKQNENKSVLNLDEED
ncbi:hypothetical protein BH20ACI1_BH20ACI1_25750 [soil metagenome]